MSSSSHTDFVRMFRQSSLQNFSEQQEILELKKKFKQEQLQQNELIRQIAKVKKEIEDEESQISLWNNRIDEVNDNRKQIEDEIDAKKLILKKAQKRNTKIKRKEYEMRKTYISHFKEMVDHSVLDKMRLKTIQSTEPEYAGELMTIAIYKITNQTNCH